MGLFYNLDKEDEIPTEVKDLVQKRALAKKEKDFKTADEIQDKVIEMGYRIEDMPGVIRIVIL